jgi:serine/threonine protein kinase
MSLVAGTRLGPYEIQSAIGAGGMGEVYRARDTRLDRTVAIKVLPPDVSGDPDRRARFEREAKTVAGLSHPHICPLFDIGDHDGAMFLVMEHLAGQTLAERLEKGSLPLEQALTVATEIADALSAAHRQGVVHRDLKPGNVMLTKAGAKLLDFGLAKLRPATALEGLAATSLQTAEPAKADDAETAVQDQPPSADVPFPNQLRRSARRAAVPAEQRGERAGRTPDQRRLRLVRDSGRVGGARSGMTVAGTVAGPRS